MLPRISLFLLLITAESQAQPASETRPVRDSAYAVRNLFRQRRANGLGTAGYGLAGLTGTVFAASRGQGVAAGLLTLNAAVSTVLAVRQYGRYSERREENLVALYEQGWPLPPEIRRRLKPKYFKPLP